MGEIFGNRKKTASALRMQKFLDFLDSTKTGFQRLPAGKLREQYFAQLGALFPDQKDLVPIFQKANDKEAEAIMEMGSLLRESGTDPIEISAIAKGEGFAGLVKLTEAVRKKKEREKGMELAGAEVPRRKITEQNLGQQGAPDTETARAGFQKRKAQTEADTIRRKLSFLTAQRREIFRTKGGTAAVSGIESRINEAREDLKRAEDNQRRFETVQRSTRLLEPILDNEGAPVAYRMVEQGRNDRGEVVFRDVVKNPQGKEIRITPTMAQFIGGIISGSGAGGGVAPGEPPSAVDEKTREALKWLEFSRNRARE